MECPECGTKFNAHACSDKNVPLGTQPRPGDVTVCSTCGIICIFGEEETVHKATDEEVIKLKEIPGLWNELYRVIYHIKENNIKAIRE